MSTLHEWASAWRIPGEAVNDLIARLSPPAAPARLARSEAAVSNQIRAEASFKGMRLWRNNVGAMYDQAGNFVRYGLANDSVALNKAIKSADLIGIRPVVITPIHIGTTIGQFVSREVKAPGWRYAGTDRERAQMAWAQLISAMGGDARIVDGEGSL